LRQIKDSLKWVNPVKKYKISVLQRIPVNGKIIPPFLLEIKDE
jgi:hypothetical protein